MDSGSQSDAAEQGRAGAQPLASGLNFFQRALCAVVARPDEKWGETPCAFVETTEDVDAAELLAFAKARLPKFAAPKTVVFGELPRTSTGKIQKFVLRERARELPS